MGELDSTQEIEAYNPWNELLNVHNIISELDNHDLIKLVNDCHADMEDLHLHGPYNDETRLKLHDLACVLHVATHERNNRGFTPETV